MAPRKIPTPTPTHVIRIDNEVFRELQSRADGFEAPNTVLRRELGLAPLVDFGDEEPMTEKMEQPTA